MLLLLGCTLPFLHQAGLLEGHSLALEVAGEATHTEKAWAERLPQALTFLCSHWWQRALRSKQGE
jgi:hypothetical protein